jgi:hypothetical protein
LLQNDRQPNKVPEHLAILGRDKTTANNKGGEARLKRCTCLPQLYRDDSLGRELPHALTASEGTKEDGDLEAETDIAELSQDAEETAMHRTACTVLSLRSIVGVVGWIVGVKPNSKHGVSMCHDCGYMPKMQATSGRSVFLIRCNGMHPIPEGMGESRQDDGDEHPHANEDTHFLPAPECIDNAQTETGQKPAPGIGGNGPKERPHE